MKKPVCIFLCALSLFLSACGGLYKNFREIERLSVVDTLGIDRIPGGVKLCLSAPSLTEEAATLSGSGDSIETAIEHIAKRSGDRELFCRQTEYIIIGEASAKGGMESTLSYIGASPLMRIDTPLYIVRGTEAGTLMRDCPGIGKVMAGIVQSSSQRGDCSVTTAAGVMRDLLTRKSALVSALELSAPAEAAEGEKTAAVNGYAVLKNGRLAAYLSEEQAVGAGFLTGNTGACSITVSDSRGGKAVLGITGGRADVFPVWAEDGSVERVNIAASVQATVDEISGNGDLDSAVYAQHLTGQLEAAVSERINSVLRLSSSLGADFLGLGERIERADPERFRLLPRPFEELLPVLEVQVSVKGTISHTNDMAGGASLAASAGRSA